MKQRFRFTPVRKLLDNEEVKDKIFKLALLMLGHYQAPPDDLLVAFEELKDRPPSCEEELVMYPSFSVMGGAYYPAFAVYKCVDVQQLNHVHIPEYENLDPDATSGLLSDNVWPFLLDISPDSRARIISKATMLPSPLLWDAISDPIGIQVNSIRAAAMIVSWTLRHRFARPYGYFPLIIGPNTEKTDPIAAYEELSRYKALYLGHITFKVDKLMEEAGIEDDEEEEGVYNDPE